MFVIVVVLRNNLKTLIFSDSHLTHKFDKEFFDYIANLIKGVDQVIINGDFWDAYLTSFRKFTRSKWQKLFPLLKQKHTVYVVGNHDKLKFMNKKYLLFSDQQVEYYEFRSGNREFYVTHGHLISPTYDNIFFFKNPIFVRFVYRFLLFLVYKIGLGYSFFKKAEFKKNTQQLKAVKKFSVQRNKDQFFIFGHSHLPMLKVSDHFISLGPLQKDWLNYCIIEDGYITLVSNM